MQYRSRGDKSERQHGYLSKLLTVLSRSIEYSAQRAGIAQLVEHNLAKVGVASSSLVSRSNGKAPQKGAFFVLKRSLGT